MKKEHHLIIKLFVARKLIGVNNLLGGQYSVNRNVRFKTPILRSNLDDYGDTYIAVKGTVDLLAAASNNAPINSDLDIAMPVYNLLEQSKN